MKELQEYYDKILEKYSSKQYKLLKFNDNPLPDIRNQQHLEAQHFMMFEWCEDHNDHRYKEIFDYIVRPNDLDMDFTKIEFEDFLEFLASIKVSKK